MASKGRVAWVTGAGRGIGRACAVALARAGHAVALSARTTAQLEGVRKECEAAGVKAVVAACDVTRRADVAKAYQQLSKTLGTPTILVNAAGLARSAPFLKTSTDFMQELWDLNVMGVFHTTQEALPAMLDAQWGRVVNIASVAGKQGAPYIAAYAASKHAVVGLTRVLAAEFAAKGVTANAICPGYVDTEMTDENVRLMVEKTGRSRDQILDFIRAQSPLGRLIRPEEVAASVLQLCHADAAAINGQSIVLDGGAIQL